MCRACTTIFCVTTSSTATTARRAALATIACAVGAVAFAPLAAAQTTLPPGLPTRPALVFGGSTAVFFDPAVLGPLGVVAAPSGRTKVNSGGAVLFRIVDGKTTLRFPQKGVLQGVGNMTLKQASSGANLNFTDLYVKLGPTKSVLSAMTGEGIGYGGPRQTLLRIAPTAEQITVKNVAFQIKNVPVTLTATGATVFNTLFTPEPPLTPFVAGSPVGTATVKTSYYFPTPGAGSGGR
jgi:hypothetical protein